MRSLPLTVVAPGCDWEAQEATKAVAVTTGTCYLRLDKSGAEDTGRPGEDFVLGKARVLREGSDVALIATGGILGVVIAAAAELAENGVDARVISMHTLKPLDTLAITSAATETRGIVTVEEHTISGGLGSAVAETCLDAGTAPGFFARIAIPGGFSSIVGSQEYLRERHGIDKKAIVKTVMDRLRKSGG